ncbi:MAG TPA: hypothetical protein VGC01_05000, partial [Mucilaginibacter sp.]
MAEDINKKITIEVELEAEKLTQNINSLNSVIDGLLARQQLLDAAGQQNSTTFNTVATQLEAFQKKLQEVNTQVIASVTAFNSLNTSAKTLNTTLSSSISQHQKNAQAASENSVKTKELAQQMISLGQSAKQQQSVVDENKNSLNSLSGSVT